MKKVVKLDAKQLGALVTGIVKEERQKIASVKGGVIRMTEANLRRIVREELTEMLGTQPHGVEFKSGQGQKGPLAGAMDDAKVDQLASKLSGFDLSDEEIDALVSKLKAEARKRRGRRI